MRLVVYCRWLSPSLSVDTRGFVLLTHYPWFDIIRVTFEKSCFPEACFLLVGWPQSVWCLNLLDEGLKANKERGQSLTKHLSWPFIPSKINLPLMCPYYCTDFNLLHPIKASPPGDTIHCRCVVFHLDSKQWLIKFAFVVLFKDIEGSGELCHRTLKEFCTPDETDPTQTNWKSSRSRNPLKYLFIYF